MALRWILRTCGFSDTITNSRGPNVNLFELFKLRFKVWFALTMMMSVLWNSGFCSDVDDDDDGDDDGDGVDCGNNCFNCHRHGHDLCSYTL